MQPKFRSVNEWKAWADSQRPDTTFGTIYRPFIVCETCGNKRCPHATDLALECTGSNEPGQAGSIYQ